MMRWELFAVERFPQRFRDLEAWQMIEAIRQVAYDIRQQLLAVPQDKDHVRVGQRSSDCADSRRPTATLRATGSRATRCVRLKALVMMGPYSENAQTAARGFSERVDDGFWKRRVVIWRIVIDKEDFVVVTPGLPPCN